MTDVLLQLLANSLWVGVAAASFAGIGSLALRSAASRHRLYCLALVAMAAIPVAQLWVPAPAVSVSAAEALPAILATHAVVEYYRPFEWSLFVWAWAAGAGLLGLLSSVRVARALAAKRSSVWVAPDLLARRAAWRAGLPPGRDGAFLESQRRRSPFAVGWLTPAIVFPVGLERRLEDADLRRLWLHEAAHLRRLDDWTAVAAEALGALLFFHPAAWWLRRRIEEQREFACDELAARWSGSEAEYALTLTRFAELQLPRPVAGELGFAGGPGLKRRIVMLLDHRFTRGAGRRGWTLALAGVGLSALLVLGPKVSWAQQQAAPAPPAAPVAPEPAPTPRVDVQIAPPQPPAPPVPPVEVDVEAINAREKELLQSLSDVQTQLELTDTPELQQQLRAMEMELHKLAQQSAQREAAHSQAAQMREAAEKMRQAVPSEEMRKQMEANANLMQAEAEKMRGQMQQFQQEMQRAQKEMELQMQENARVFEAEAERSAELSQEFQREMERVQREAELKQRESEEEPKPEPEFF